MPCSAETPPCATWEIAFPEVEAITLPTIGADSRHVYLGAALEAGAGALYAIDPTNGIQLWRRPLPGSPQRPAFSDLGVVVVAYDDPVGGTGVRTFDPETGELLSRTGAGLFAQATGPPATAGSMFAVGGPRRMLLHSLGDTSVTIVELTDIPVALLGSGDRDRPAVVLQTDHEEARAYGSDGSVLWGRTSSVLGTAVEDGRTALLDLPGHVVGVDVSGGEIWRTPLGVDRFAPIVADGEVLVRTLGGEAARLSLVDGRELGRSRWEVLAGPDVTVDDGIAYVPTCPGFVAVDVASGQALWDLDLSSQTSRCAEPAVAPPDGGPLLVVAGNRLYGVPRR